MPRDTSGGQDEAASHAAMFLEEPYFQAAMRGMHTLYCHDQTFTLRLEDLTPTEWAPPREAVSLYSAKDRGVCSVPLAKLHAPPAHQRGHCPATCSDWPLHANTTPYNERGWCAAEQQWSLSRGKPWRSMRLPLGTPEICEAPLTPEAFADAVRAGGLKFTHRGDAEPVLQLQRHVFETKTAVTASLDFADLGPDGVRAAADCLPHCRRLTELRLINSNVGDEGAQVLARGLENCSPLELLWLFTSSIGDNGCKALAAALAGHRGLRDLNLDANGFGDAGAEALANGLQYHTRLEDVRLFENSIGEVGCKALANVLSKQKKLRALNLRTNHLGDAGAEALGNAPAQMSSLQELRLQQNAITDAGAQALARNLQHTALRELWLSENEIGDLGCQALAAAIEQLPLHTLHLEKNSIGKSGAHALVKGLQHKSLESVHVQENCIDGPGCEALQQLRIKDLRCEDQQDRSLTR
ncbi:unnamed protein product [Effrenium voratum]|nr:unnamed protein product [Effrenium voratum]